jgi:hypothetical protein
MSNNNDGALDWDDKISNDGDDFPVLPDGEYPFTVTAFERARHGGSEKLPPCNKAVLTIKIDGGDKGTTTVKNNLFLHRKTEGLISDFFRSIGAKSRGQAVIMDWGSVVGASGRCQVGHRVYNGEKYNEIKRFKDPAKGQAPAKAAPANVQDDDEPF